MYVWGAGGKKWGGRHLQTLVQGLWGCAQSCTGVAAGMPVAPGRWGAVVGGGTDGAWRWLWLLICAEARGLGGGGRRWEGGLCGGDGDVCVCGTYMRVSVWGVDTCVCVCMG